MGELTTTIIVLRAYRDALQFGTRWSDEVVVGIKGGYSAYSLQAVEPAKAATGRAL